MKRYIAIHCWNGYQGCDLDEVLIFDHKISDKEISETVYEIACENADSYSYVHFGWGVECSEGEYEDYIMNNVVFDWYDMTYSEYLEYCKKNNLNVIEED